MCHNTKIGCPLSRSWQSLFRLWLSMFIWHASRTRQHLYTCHDGSSSSLWTYGKRCCLETWQLWWWIIMFVLYMIVVICNKNYPPCWQIISALKLCHKCCNFKSPLRKALDWSVKTLHHECNSTGHCNKLLLIYLKNRVARENMHE